MRPANTKVHCVLAKKGTQLFTLSKMGGSRLQPGLLSSEIWKWVERSGQSGLDPFGHHRKCHHLGRLDGGIVFKLSFDHFRQRPFFRRIAQNSRVQPVPARIETVICDGSEIMGDKSPKETSKKAAQKQAKANTNNQQKNAAAAAKQVVKPKR